MGSVLQTPSARFRHPTPNEIDEAIDDLLKDVSAARKRSAIEKVWSAPSGSTTPP